MSSPYSLDNPLADHYLNAVELDGRGDVHGALASFQAATRFSPDDYHHWYNLAVFQTDTSIRNAKEAADRAYLLAPHDIDLVHLIEELKEKIKLPLLPESQFYRVCAQNKKDANHNLKVQCAEAATSLWREGLAWKPRIFATIMGNEEMWPAAEAAFTSALRKMREPDTRLISITTLLSAANSQPKISSPGIKLELFGNHTTPPTRTFKHVHQRTMDDDSILLCIKTGAKFYKDRIVNGIAKTWLPNANKHTYLVGDNNDSAVQLVSGHRLVPTGCNGRDLCCKYQQEMDIFWRMVKTGSELSWFCHVDDDVYLLPFNLQMALTQYKDPRQISYFLGANPLYSNDRQWLKFQAHLASRKKPGRELMFSGGPHAMDLRCISRALMDRMRPLMQDGLFKTKCRNEFKGADDLAEAFFITDIIGVRLNVIPGAHIKYHRTMKLPYFSQKILQKSIVLPDFGNIKTVHTLLYKNLTNEEWLRLVKNMIPYQSSTQQRKNRGRKLRTKINWCKVPMPPPLKLDDLYNAPISTSARRCGVPAILPRNEYQKLCRLNEGSVYIHSQLDVYFDSTDIMRWVDAEHACPYYHVSAPAFWGTILPADKFPVEYEPSCCMPNPQVPVEEGRDCFWTAPDQSMCQKKRVPE